LQRQRQTSQRFGDICLEMALISEQQLMDVLAEQWRIPTVQLRKGLVDMKIFSVLPRDKTQRYGVRPMFKVEETLTIATPVHTRCSPWTTWKTSPSVVSSLSCAVPKASAAA
jgi:hypothetical protein